MSTILKEVNILKKDKGVMEYCAYRRSDGVQVPFKGKNTIGDSFVLGKNHDPYFLENFLENFIIFRAEKFFPRFWRIFFVFKYTKESFIFCCSGRAQEGDSEGQKELIFFDGELPSTIRDDVLSIVA